MDMIDEEDVRKVKQIDDHSTFRFGDGNEVVSNKIVEVPAIIGSKQ